MAEFKSANDSSQPQSTMTDGRQAITLAALCTVTFLGATIYAIQAPFYPAAAESKNATPSEYGAVLGSFGLTQFFLGPVFGSYLHKLGVKNTFHGGILVAATSTILFGFLIFVNNTVLFLVLSFLLRVIEAIGALAMVVAVYTIAATDFPGSVARSFAIVETVYGLGLSLGAPIGIALSSIGGFTLPFLVLGIFQFLSGIISYFVLPKSVGENKEVSTPSSPSSAKKNLKVKKVGFVALLKVPAVTTFACAIVVAVLTSSFIASLLEPNLREFNLSPVMLAAMFLLPGLTQAVFSIIWGYISDRIPRPDYITLIGAILLTISTFFIGPFYCLPMEPSLVLTGLSLVLLGLGGSAVLVSAFLQGLTEAKNHGFPSNTATSGLVSGIFTSCISFGCFSGPFSGGVLFEALGGFRPATSVLCGINSVMMLILLLLSLLKTPGKESGCANTCELQGIKVLVYSD